MNVLEIGGCTHLYGKGPLPFLMGTSGGLEDSVTLPPSGEPRPGFPPLLCRPEAILEGPGSPYTGAGWDRVEGDCDEWRVPLPDAIGMFCTDSQVN